MVERNAGFPDEQTTTSNELLLTVNPNTEVLHCFVSRDLHIYTLDDTASLTSREEKGSKVDLWGYGFFCVTREITSEEDHGGLGHSNAATAQQS